MAGEVSGQLYGETGEQHEPLVPLYDPFSFEMKLGISKMPSFLRCGHRRNHDFEQIGVRFLTNRMPRIILTSFPSGG